MADCFSLPNAAEIRIDLLHFPDQNTIRQAADAIEQLMQENAKLKAGFDECYAANEDLFHKLEQMKAERDAAVADIPHFCDKCKHLNDAYCVGCKWEWRGVRDD